MPKVPQPSALSIDFSNVGERTAGGRSAHVPEGDYLFQVIGYEIRTKKDDETSKYISWRLQIAKPEKYKSAGLVYHITSLKEESLWSLRNFLEDLGLKVPQSVAKVPLKTIVERKLIIGGTVEDDEYNNKVKSKIVATFKKSEYEETGETEDEETDAEEDDEVEEAPTTKSKKKAKSPEPEEEDESDEDEDLEELDVDDI